MEYSVVRKRNWVSLLCLCSFSIILTFAACSPTQHVRGNFLDLEMIKKIEPGKTTKREVEELLGPASSQELFGKAAWYYIGDKVETRSFFDPKIVEREILIVTFSDNGTVSACEVKDLKDHREIEIKKEATPVKGKDPSLVSELFGNIGRYSAPKKTAKR